jgi:glycosyltransferase involved in cell wall biosynthesis
MGTGRYYALLDISNILMKQGRGDEYLIFIDDDDLLNPTEIIWEKIFYEVLEEEEIECINFWNLGIHNKIGHRKPIHFTFPIYFNEVRMDSKIYSQKSFFERFEDPYLVFPHLLVSFCNNFFRIRYIQEILKEFPFQTMEGVLDDCGQAFGLIYCANTKIELLPGYEDLFIRNVSSDSDGNKGYDITKLPEYLKWLAKLRKYLMDKDVKRFNNLQSVIDNQLLLGATVMVYKNLLNEYKQI